MKKRVMYGVANYEEIVSSNGYFVDKTRFIKELESINSPVFLRPRWFGKSLWCRVLECYYDINKKDDFARLFGQTWIGRHPTAAHNSCLVLSLDFSSIEPEPNLAEIEHNFKRYCNSALEVFCDRYAGLLGQTPAVIIEDAVSANLNSLLNYLGARNLPPLYVIIDECDNFTN